MLLTVSQRLYIICQKQQPIQELLKATIFTTVGRVSPKVVDGFRLTFQGYGANSSTMFTLPGATHNATSVIFRYTHWTYTCSFVADEFAVFHLANGGEERVDVILRHGLRQVVDDDVGFVDVIVGRVERLCWRVAGRQVTTSVVLE